MLGTPALFATAYGNVGSSIYYALGVTAVFALGLTPLVFLIAGFIFACTAATYAEGTVLYPEAGGSSSFARHAFNELVCFGAAWAQMLNYIITIAISAFFVPHYLSIFWEPLRQNPWDIVVGVVVIVVLVRSTSSAIQEAASAQHPARGRRLRDAAAARRCSASSSSSIRTSSARTSTGGRRPPGRTSRLRSRSAMIAYTGIETVSNLAEEARDPRADDPGARSGSSRSRSSRSTSRCRSIALSALPVKLVDGEYMTTLGLTRRSKAASRTTRCSGSSRTSDLHGTFLSAAKIYVGILAATILFIATNAGVIGASRITYSMASYRQLPEVFRRLHPRFKTPWLSLVVFAGLFSICDPARQVGLSRDDVLVRRDALVHGRARRRDPAATQAARSRSRTAAGRT